ncbi:putative TetR family transcriptional regulator [Actinacidiphila reveromycinica]|uniref:Putative TetR family transcriptional regulator n=1 Tax=Actinacidiphila reveromycinica TaxID=659352 RepID=A0A7U3UTV9_9ACTN|nr:TetR/AcrR family transcriptional regulator [Streptomyces sp. SN-593]BBA98536.1 putative TetR family transcriptional regulator [Streptomyces sp. SN-593]
MSIQTRRERERAEREQLIVTTARELAEAEGWDAVTTRRLAAEIEYSQPVLYGHFKGKNAIMTAVAVQGCAELAVALRAARTRAGSGSKSGAGSKSGSGSGDARAALAAVAAAYTAFSRDHPALYDAMFTHAVELPFATPEAPAPLQDAFAEILAAVAPLAAPDDVPGILTETFWAALHGLVTLMRSGRLPAPGHEYRLALLIARFAPDAGPAARPATAG